MQGIWFLGNRWIQSYFGHEQILIARKSIGTIGLTRLCFDISQILPVKCGKKEHCANCYCTKEKISLIEDDRYVLFAGEIYTPIETQVMHWKQKLDNNCKQAVNLNADAK